ncbi:N-acetylmuramoyl-L-alanine amidase [Clostridium magnum]|uniref:Sporulation-specific N-acetylmuramoyl-L-alanine amidase n=1 Tax=Clostridium magnum DSM 2767 TaxID=1121326 RepID=A0A168E256_9CLOT|nr:N-acetylmuramoyl-L-alanine amidase [Clostridium magnum]KZL93574.1 sporulation-specific N-acetylmuramoyl-L-alanine amidase [Clostridium magnum DSM 2767]SHI59734.1 Putative peptidoglycan binding domain-containing protein [Clostridium magnum DSM 2767]
MLSLNTIIAMDMGHTLSGPDYGTSAIKEESLLTREVGERVIAKLRALGYKVVNCSCDKATNIDASLYYRYDTANNSGAGIFISIHFNATIGGFGTEIYTYGSKEIPEAVAVLNAICALGYKNRGIKDGKGLAVIKHTNMPAMLVECCFVDSQHDMNIYNAEAIADAIVKGLTGQTVSNTVTSTTSTVKISDAIKALQYDLNIDYNAKLTLTGIADAATIAALKGIQSIIVKRHKSSVVKWIQQKLIGYGYLDKGTDTGIYDEPTFQAVTNMQKNWGRPTDGILRIETWNIFLNN